MSRSSYISYTPCFAQVNIAIYSASVVNVDTERYLRLSQNIAFLPSRKTLAVVDFRLNLSSPQSASK
jgi:hypothetical protein